jgi:putative tryptophan/tyrosine transport system substrate-binding protein
MRRRVFCGAVGALLATPATFGQPTAVRRIAILEHADAASRAENWRVFEARMRELGYVEGANLRVERRWAGGNDQRVQPLAQELLASSPEVMLVSTTPATKTVMRLTHSVPIVFTGAADPVASGLVASLARPGGNVTGLSSQLPDINEKRFDLFREILPGAKRFALLGPASNSGVQAVMRQLRAAAHSTGADVRLLDASDAASIAGAFEQIRKEPLDGLLVASVLVPHNPQIAGLAAQFRIPASYIQKEALDAGALFVFGQKSEAQYRRAADFVHRILAGAKPADLPVEQPSEFWLGVNLRTARVLGLNVPQSVLLRADRVID